MTNKIKITSIVFIIRTWLPKIQHFKDFLTPSTRLQSVLTLYSVSCNTFPSRKAHCIVFVCFSINTSNLYQLRAHFGLTLMLPGGRGLAQCCNQDCLVLYCWVHKTVRGGDIQRMLTFQIISACELLRAHKHASLFIIYTNKSHFIAPFYL